MKLELKAKWNMIISGYSMWIYNGGENELTLAQIAQLAFAFTLSG
jgi:hypothetical protein